MMLSEHGLIFFFIFMNWTTVYTANGMRFVDIFVNILFSLPYFPKVVKGPYEVVRVLPVKLE